MGVSVVIHALATYEPILEGSKMQTSQAALRQSHLKNELLAPPKSHLSSEKLNKFKLLMQST